MRNKKNLPSTHSQHKRTHHPAFVQRLKARVAAAKEATLAAAQVTGYLVKQVQWMAQKAADRLAPVLAERLSRPPETAAGVRLQKAAVSGTARQAVVAAKAGVRGALVIVEGVEAAAIVRSLGFLYIVWWVSGWVGFSARWCAACVCLTAICTKTLARALSGATVETVKHKCAVGVAGFFCFCFAPTCWLYIQGMATTRLILQAQHWQLSATLQTRRSTSAASASGVFSLSECCSLQFLNPTPNPPVQSAIAGAAAKKTAAGVAEEMHTAKVAGAIAAAQQTGALPAAAARPALEPAAP
jgi:hypothetical protein